MAYLGRISAVLTANTRDFTRQIGTARRELQGFANQARGIQLNLDNRALNGTLTNLQRFRRTLQEIERLQAAGVGAGLPNTRRLNDQFRAFEDLGRPITDVKNKIEGLSNAIQAELYPELQKVQGGFQNLYRDIGNGVTTFDQSARRIENLTTRLIGLSRAVAALSDFGSLTKQLNAGNTGASFFAPRAQEALQQSLALRGQAQGLPSRFRGGKFADLAVLAEENAERIERAAARVASAQAQIDQYGKTPNRLGRRSRAQAELDAATRQQRGINLQFQREIASAQIQQIVSPEAVRKVDALIERAGTLAAKLRENNNTRFDPLIASVSRVIERLNQGQISAKRAKEAVDALAGADFSRAFAASSFTSADKVLRTDSERSISEIRKNAAAERAQVIGRSGALSLIGPNRMRQIGDINRRESVSLDREQFNSQTVERISGLRSRAEQLNDPRLTKGFNDIRRLAQDVSASIKSAFDEEDPKKAALAVAAYQSKLGGLVAKIGEYESALSSAETASRRFAQFLELSGSRSDKLGSSLTRFASDIATTRQLAGNFSATNVSGRAAVERQLERSIKFADRIARAQQKIADNDKLSDAEKRRRRQLVDRAVSIEGEKNLDVLVNASGGTLTKKRAKAAMDRNAKNQGSIGVSGIASAQLAFQQGLFAVDDFISSTGGLEYKLRAIGNNITQLGLLLGQSGLISGLNATTGLFVSLGVVLAGQATLGILRWANGAESADDQTKALTESLSRQRSLVEQLAKSFESLGDSISQRAFAQGDRAARDFAKSLAEISKQQKALREERLTTLDPASFEATKRAAALERRLGASTDAGQAIALAEAKAMAEAESRRAAAAAGGRVPSLRDSINAVGVGPRNRSESLNRAYAIGIDALARSFIPVNPITPFFRSRASGPAATEEARRRIEATRGDREAQIDAIRRRREQIRSVAQADIGFESAVRGDSQAIARLSREFAALTLQLTLLTDAAKSDNALIRFLKSLDSAASGIETAQSQVEDAIRSGVPGAVLLRSQLSNIASEVDAAQKSINKANEEFQKSSQTPDERKKRDDAVASAQRAIANSSIERARLEAESNILTRRRIVDPQGLFESRRARAVENLQAAGVESGAIARRIRELDAYRARLESDLARDPGSANRVAEGTRAVDEEMAAIESTTLALKRFTEALVRAAQESDSNLQSARQREQEARRSDIGRSTPESALTRRRAEQDLRNQESLNNRVRDEIAKVSARLESQTQFAGGFARIREINDALASGGLQPQEQLRLIEERRRLQDQIDRALEQEQSVIDARDASIREEERQQSAARGAELRLRPGERARRELDQQLADLSNDAASRVADAIRGGRFGDIGGIQQRLEQDRQRVQEDKMREQAPAIFGLADSVANALLQGPSRAALQPTDVSTVEGSRELTRLLRGDDAARDQANLVELQKEANKLLDMIARNPAQIAN